MEYNSTIYQDALKQRDKDMAANICVRMIGEQPAEVRGQPAPS
jgi:hypothetical protein